LANAHFWLMLLGVFLGYISLLVAGLWQGLMLNDPSHSFVAVMFSTMVAIRVSTLGPLLLVLATLAFLLNFALLIKNYACRCCHAWTTENIMRKGNA
jgi:cbb3-type cytochrome oxidase subunit 1